MPIPKAAISRTESSYMSLLSATVSALARRKMMPMPKTVISRTQRMNQMGC